ncbi:TIGR02391 family protein [Actinoplanes sp. TFC3]|uniref:TIGR02391 family protein n=1 Tax=Actinoplanes sp. TFC3 TaxID=1710355 RepID=UPI000A424DF1|nr:TIGR02391 family protein [Actinoplanes sp. TFC3]
MTYTPIVAAGDAIGLPVDRVGLHLLHAFANGSGPTARSNVIQGLKQTYSQNEIDRQTSAAAVRAVVEALDWLRHAGLIAPDPDQSAEFFIISRLGQQVVAASDGLALIQAARRIDVDLHPRIADRVRSQFLLGEYEFAAMREVEIRVRELAGASDSEIGVKLMRSAFGPTGPLTDASLDGGERDAVSSLFAGAIGVFKNPSSHRQVTYSDPTVASEVILLGDLLLRMLDTTAARLSKK